MREWFKDESIKYSKHISSSMNIRRIMNLKQFNGPSQILEQSLNHICTLETFTEQIKAKCFNQLTIQSKLIVKVCQWKYLNL